MELSIIFFESVNIRDAFLQSCELIRLVLLSKEFGCPDLCTLLSSVHVSSEEEEGASRTCFNLLVNGVADFIESLKKGCTAPLKPASHTFERT